MASPKTLNGINIILGAGAVGDAKDPYVRYSTKEQTQELLKAFLSRGYTLLDAAANYSPHAPRSCEKLLGEADIKNLEVDGRKIVIDTKLPHAPADFSETAIARDLQTSLDLMGVEKVRTLYLHFPDKTADPVGICRAMDNAIKERKIEQWGICNDSADFVVNVCKIAEENGWSKPSLYQGLFNCVSKGAWEMMEETAKKNGIGFAGFSPGVGGLFAPTSQNTRSGGRFDGENKSNITNQGYIYFFQRPEMLEASKEIQELGAKHGIAGHHAVLRWSVWHSVLSGDRDDEIILAASSVKQLHENLDALEAGPLPEELAEAIDGLWAEVKEVAPPPTLG